MVERKGKIKATVVRDTRKSTVMPIMKEHVKLESDVMTDEDTL